MHASGTAISEFARFALQVTLAGVNCCGLAEFKAVPAIKFVVDSGQPERYSTAVDVVSATETVPMPKALLINTGGKTRCNESTLHEVYLLTRREYMSSSEGASWNWCATKTSRALCDREISACASRVALPT